MSQQLLQNFSV